MFQKFMNKKFFHPGSLKNMQKIWETEKKEEDRLKLEADMASKYQREQEVINNKLLYINDDERLKQGLSFMYDVPLSVVAKDEVQIVDKKPENMKNDSSEKLKPTEEEIEQAIQKNSEDQMNLDIDTLKSSDPLNLARGLFAERGLVFSKNVVNNYFDPVPIHADGSRNENETFLIGDDTFQSETFAGTFLDEVASEMEYIKSLSYEEKKRLLRKLEKADGDDDDVEQTDSIRSKSPSSDEVASRIYRSHHHDSPHRHRRSREEKHRRKSDKHRKNRSRNSEEQSSRHKSHRRHRHDGKRTR